MKLSKIVHIILFFSEEQISDLIFGQERPTQDTHDFKETSINLKIVLDDSSETINYDGNVDLNPDRILRITPKGFNLQVLFNKFKKKFNLPSMFVKQGNILGLKFILVGIVRECSIQFRSIINYSSHLCRILFDILLVGESYRLVSKHIVIAFKQVNSSNNFIGVMPFFSNDEECTDLVDIEESCKVKIASVKYIACPCLVRNIIHCVDIMYFSWRNREKGWYLRNYIKHSVHLYSRFGATEGCPLKDGQAQGNGCGVKSIKLPMKNKLSVNSLFLGKFYHVISKTLKDAIVAYCVSTGQDRFVDRFLANTKMITFLVMCRKYISQFSEAVTSTELPKYQCQQLIPMSESPSPGPVIMLLHKSLKVLNRQEFYNLTKNIFSIVHIHDFNLVTKVSNRGHGFYYNNICKSDIYDRFLI